MTTTPPALNRPSFHVWLGTEPEDPDPAYLGQVSVTVADQLTAEVQGRAQGLQDMKAQPMRTTALWIWSACVRRGLTRSRFPEFCNLMDYRPVEASEEPEGDPDAGPTGGADGPNTLSDSSSLPSSGEDPSIGASGPEPMTT